MLRNPANILLLAAAVLALAVLVWITMGTRLMPAYPGPVVERFVGQCMEAGLDRETCTCIVEDMQEQYRLDQAIRLGLAMRNTGEVPPEIESSAAWCL
jgi:hypothetical protein